MARLTKILTPFEYDQRCECAKNENGTEYSLIESMELTHCEVLIIVKEWYLNGSYPDIVQNEDGLDLEEIIDDELTKINRKQ